MPALDPTFARSVPRMTPTSMIGSFFTSSKTASRPKSSF